MLARKPPQRSRSSSSEYQTPLPHLSAFASPEHGSPPLSWKRKPLVPDFSHLFLTLWAFCYSVSPRLTIAGQQEESFFNPHDKPSSPLSSARCAIRGTVSYK